MMRSMFSGVSGLRVHQTKMDVIANNISNVNTVGYKSSRVTFNEVFNQTVSGASKNNQDTGRGGTNPMQIGLGANVATIDKIMTTGAAQRTDRAFDVMIQGDGFFIVGDASGTYFTRAGTFDTDESGYLVHTGSGLLVYGWDAIKDEKVGSASYGKYVIEQGLAKPIVIGGEKEYVDPSTTSSIKFEGNLRAGATTSRQGTMDFYDSVGNRYVVDVLYEYEPAKPGATANDEGEDAYWTVSMGNIAYANGVRTQPGINVSFDTLATGECNIKFMDQAPVGSQVRFTDPNPDPTQDDTARYIAALRFNEYGKLDQVVAINGAVPAAATNFPAWAPAATKVTGFNIKVGVSDQYKALVPNSVFGDVANHNIAVDFSEMRQQNETSNPQAVMKNGNKPGELVGMSIGPDGIITGRYSNDETRVLGQIPLARFKNPGGLEKVGDNLFVTTANSGGFDGTGTEATSGGGKLLGGVLEMSNVDLSQEFTEMITTQRGFQANSRIITTSDDMLQELVNLKR